MTQVSIARAEALAFLKDHKAGVIATLSPQGTPHASVVYYVCDENFNIYFATRLKTRKYEAIRANPSVAFVVGTQDKPQTIQMEGIAVEMQDGEETSAHATELIKVLTSNTVYYPPLVQLGKSDIVVLWLKPTWVRWADYSPHADGSRDPLTVIPV